MSRQDAVIIGEVGCSARSLFILLRLAIVRHDNPSSGGKAPRTSGPIAQLEEPPAHNR